MKAALFLVGMFVAGGVGAALARRFVEKSADDERDPDVIDLAEYGIGSDRRPEPQPRRRGP